MRYLGIILTIVFLISYCTIPPQEVKPINKAIQGGGQLVIEEHSTIKPERIYLGEFKVTFYNGDGSAIEGGSNDRYGNPLKAGVIAVDDDIMAMKAKYKIEFPDSELFEHMDEPDIYESLDVGGGIKGNHIDVYVPGASQEDLMELGVKYCKVYMEV